MLHDISRLVALRTVRCSLMRGGTSKGVFFRKEDLPSSRPKRDEILLKVFGSGDPMQLDGLGGAQTQSSKTMLVSRSRREGVDLDYLFGQVSVDGWFVDYLGNCGNLTSAVGPFGIDEGLIKARGSRARVKMYNVNTKKRVDALIPIEDRMTNYRGSYMIDGVPRPGARIDVVWYDPAGAVSGRLLPTGQVTDQLTLDGKTVTCSILDVANPVVFVRADQMGMAGTELPGQVSKQTLEELEAVRSRAAQMMGLVKRAADATRETPHMPFIAAVGKVRDFSTSDGRKISKGSYGVLARLFSMQKMHHAYAVTGAICTAAAAMMPGSVVNALAEGGGRTVKIGHPKGVIDIEVKTKGRGQTLSIDTVTVGRTARRLMSGLAYYYDN
jgi:2-methylaconitate cis-trans-isomerase PrpF